MHAAQGGQVAIARALLVEGANLEAKDTSGLSPIDWAQQRGHFRMVKTLDRAKENKLVPRAKK